ncbi:hypothetical protein V5E97_32675 [Singulisphaera sp. Ch08]|uniref:Uncharacterized protein n=1 Tax=Singulisphaera sp. Ch08 TaxID=3120278 RepID=A0AAU7CCX5_9BACT
MPSVILSSLPSLRNYPQSPEILPQSQYWLPTFRGLEVGLNFSQILEVLEVLRATTRRIENSVDFLVAAQDSTTYLLTEVASVVEALSARVVSLEVDREIRDNDTILI